LDCSQFTDDKIKSKTVASKHFFPFFFLHILFLFLVGGKRCFCNLGRLLECDTLNYNTIKDLVPKLAWVRGWNLVLSDKEQS